MPTPRLQRYWILALLVGVTSQAQDLHIKKSITFGGNFISSTDTSIKGPRERTVSQTPTGNTVTVRQCDLKQTITINEQAQTYFVQKDPQDEEAIKAAALVTGAPQADSGSYITETAAITDTGERKTIYGYPSRHLRVKVTVVSSKNACSQLNQQYEVDGWYADIAKEMGSCQQSLPPVRQNEGCNDHVIRKYSGSAKLGYPLAETLTFHNPDGRSAQIGVQTSEITRPQLEKELFDIPAGYREVKSVAELEGVPSQLTAQSQPPVAQGAPNGIKRPNMANLMLNPAAQLQFQQQANAMGQQLMGGSTAARQSPGMNVMNSGGGAPYGMQGGTQAVSATPSRTALGPKQTGRIRIGVAPPDAQVGQGSNASGDYSTPIRNAEIALMSGPVVDIAPLDSHIAMQLQAEAQQKECDFILYSSVVVQHSRGSGFGRFAKLAASITPMGAMAHGVAGAAAAQAAGMAASQMAQQQAMNHLSGLTGQIKSKDDVTVRYQLVAPGQSSPVLENKLQAKAKSDGEDVLTPLLTQAATTVLTQVSQK